ncbi:MAG: DUF2480 family protein [Chitinophagaceae bacterium]|nr:DUF2480 family protein [Chitinophagaceae bacterium]MCW5904192.1 DUF2480 family protein [Chitinophagaceae bacterium]
MSEVFINKVAESGIVTLNLEDFYPKENIELFDLKDFLFMGLILKEKEFRTALQNIDWGIYKNKIIGITCTTDAIIPVWAYMLVASYLQPEALYVSTGDKETITHQLLLQRIDNINPQDYTDKRVVIKGCGDIAIPALAYTAITFKLKPVVKSIMYGEPCSTVPIYKRK